MGMMNNLQVSRSPEAQGGGNSKRRLRRAEPFSMTIFGGSGDLTSRKLVPAMYRLTLDGHFPDEMILLGVSRRPWSDEYFRDYLRTAVEQSLGSEVFDSQVWERFAQRIFYLPGDADDPETFGRVDEALRTVGRDLAGRPDRNRLYYLSTLPRLYPALIEGLGMMERERAGEGWGRVVVEKPFGSDLASAVSLNRLLAQHFEEQQIFRIDHYLGKETVQNLMVLRFANGIFEPIWNRHYIDHVQITVAESLGVEHRATYFEEAGALRDMVQNHMLQLLSLIAMEPPASFDAGAIRNEKVKVLRSMPLPTRRQIATKTVRGQYTAGTIEGKSVPGYRDEPDVDPASDVETYAALRLDIDNWRWAGVPFYLRTGKRLPKRTSEIVVSFRCPPHLPFQRAMASELRSNALVLQLQPQEGIRLSIGAKVPGPEIQIRNVDMEFFYEGTFQERSAEAYEYLLLEAILGDTTMFTRGDEAEAAWALISRIREAWDDGVVPLSLYPAGSWGPDAASALLQMPQACAPGAVSSLDPWHRHLQLVCADDSCEVDDE